MGQQETTGAHTDDSADGGTAVIGAATEFEPDVMDLLVATLRRAVKWELPAVGTDTLLGELVMGDTDAGEAIAPGMRKAGSLSGMIAGRAGRGWASDDEARGEKADEQEVDAAWREARWRYGEGVRGSAPEGGWVLPGMSGALRACLLLALRSARAEGTISVRCRHVARALLELPDSRAREALVLQRLDLSAAATALDALDASAASAPSAASDASAPARTEGPESRGVALLRHAGTLGKSGNRLTRALISWTSGSAMNGSPVLAAVSTEAMRQAVRSGRAAVEPVDLLLGILALDRALFVAGRSLPANLAKANSAPALMRRHGVRQSSLVTSASVTPSAAVPDDGEVRPSAAADRVTAVAQLSAAEHGSPTVGTVHLLSALLDESATDTDAGSMVVRLLAADQVDVAALRAEVGLRLGA